MYLKNIFPQNDLADINTSRQRKWYQLWRICINGIKPLFFLELENLKKKIY